MNKSEYVHGYDKQESIRLIDQAKTLVEFLHQDVRYPKNSKILEAGCGIGAQTQYLTKNNPDSHFISIDISEESLNQAKQRIKGENISNVTFQIGNIFNLEFEDESFDHIFVCFVLEHLSDPVKALNSLRRVLRNGGTITVIEGDHGSCYFHPETRENLMAWKSLIEVQASLGGNSLIGRELYPLLNNAGFNEIHISPLFIYIDETKPALVDGFIKKTIIPMVEGVKEKAINQKLLTEELWIKGIKDLHRTAKPDGTFCYVFFKGLGKK